MSQLSAAKTVLEDRAYELLTTLNDFYLALGGDQEKARELSDLIDVRLESLKSAKDTAKKVGARYQNERAMI